MVLPLPFLVEEYGTCLDFVPSLRCPNQYANTIRPANKIAPSVTPTPVPIFALGERPDSVAVVLGLELIVVERLKDVAVSFELGLELIVVERLKDIVVIFELVSKPVIVEG